MSKIIPPSIGRQVWYWPSLDESEAPGGRLAGAQGIAVLFREQPCAATVVCVLDDRRVNLVILDHEGRAHFRGLVRLRQPGDEKPAGGYAEWMPHQVSQAGVLPLAAAADESASLRGAAGGSGPAVGFDLLRGVPLAEQILPAQMAAARQAAQAKPRTVTREQVEAEIASEHFFTAADGIFGSAVEKVGLLVAANKAEGLPESLDLLTCCVLVLKNGHRVVGVNYGAADPSVHSAEVGREEAREDAICEVFKLLVFRQRDELAGASGWISCATPPKDSGEYLVTVQTDGGRETHVLYFNGKNWIHEGEPTFCHSYHFRPVSWKARPEADATTRPEAD